MSERVDLGIVAALEAYLKTLATLRQRAGDAQRDAYTVAIGQLRGHGLCSEEQWRWALDLPRLRDGEDSKP